MVMVGKSEELAKIRAYASYKYLKTITHMAVWGERTIRIYAAKWYGCYGDLLWATDIVLEKGEPPPGSGFVDMRTLADTAAGCCPPVLTKGFIMQEGGEMAERDPVLEAMKLHKRGYFGGGG